MKYKSPGILPDGLNSFSVIATIPSDVSGFHFLRPCNNLNSSDVRFMKDTVQSKVSSIMQKPRSSGIAPQSNIQRIYLPLIKKGPTSPSSVLTAIEKRSTLRSGSVKGQKVLTLKGCFNHKFSFYMF